MIPDTRLTPDEPACLVVGGTGMLLPACRSLAGSGWRVHAIGRTSRDIAYSPGLNLHHADWHGREAYLHLLAEVARSMGPARIAVVAWIHSDAAISHEDIQNRLAPADYLEVRGSTVLEAGSGLSCETSASRRRVILGWVAQGAGRRWLTDEEISEGVIDALLSGRTRSQVGQLSG